MSKPDEETRDVNDEELIAALEANGREDMADTIKAENLAKQLVDSGRDDLAALMAEPPAPAAKQSEGEAFLEELRAAQERNTTSLPGLLDE
jgi:hypothetical protein